LLLKNDVILLRSYAYKVRCHTNTESARRSLLPRGRGYPNAFSLG